MKRCTTWLGALALALLALGPAPALAWGELGHKTVGAIASDVLAREHPATLKQVQAILPPGETLSSVAVWPDCVKYPKADYCVNASTAQLTAWVDFRNKVGNVSIYSYHYADVDIAAPGYVWTAQPLREDVVHGIQESTAALQGQSGAPANPYGLTRTEALWLLTHLVGDIHQPLHIGVLPINGDLNATQGSGLLFPDASHCLHANWDDLYVQQAAALRGIKTPQAYAVALLQAEREGQLAPVARASSPKLADWPIQWANDSLALARDRALAKVQVPNPGQKVVGTCGFGPVQGWAISLPPGYEAMAQASAEQQLLKAGHRLADLLAAIF